MRTEDWIKLKLRGGKPHRWKKSGKTLVGFEPDKHADPDFSKDANKGKWDYSVSMTPWKCADCGKETVDSHKPKKTDHLPCG